MFISFYCDNEYLLKSCNDLLTLITAPLQLKVEYSFKSVLSKEKGTCIFIVKHASAKTRELKLKPENALVKAPIIRNVLRQLAECVIFNSLSLWCCT